MQTKNGIKIEKNNKKIKVFHHIDIDVAMYMCVVHKHLHTI